MNKATTTGFGAALAVLGLTALGACASNAPYASPRAMLDCQTPAPEGLDAAAGERIAVYKLTGEKARKLAERNQRDGFYRYGDGRYSYVVKPCAAGSMTAFDATYYGTERLLVVSGFAMGNVMPAERQALLVETPGEVERVAYVFSTAE
ncbi:hypothetical protein [Parvularcula dongshanensis]|uniref:Type IV pilus biogenesis protein CpaD/CtpE n=1 Tax=Parvularcula dongshanensis TaxID=1173995 RepID=A0A840I007_9PROT|nr:hypothetical protein [Parvularcula dongshanensis]MBB4658416.1 type IV pilus biogenesis protein CpaD/CtpE [Parvularcula dongshanensis]